MHSLLADVPNEITVRCNNAAGLAERMLHAKAIESLQFNGEEELVIGTCSPVTVYQRLPEWTADAGVQIQELRCSDDSLQALFTSLLQIHRGRA
jgi:ABC-2 type transport system ATP-binding protein